jgi:arylsulfatase A-like enzyme
MGSDSFSFYKLLKGEQDHLRPPIIHHSVNGTFSIRHGKWKMIFSDGSGGRQKPTGQPFSKPYQLYNMDQDPAEERNVIADHQEVKEILNSYLDQMIKNEGDFNFGKDN